MGAQDQLARFVIEIIAHEQYRFRTQVEESHQWADCGSGGG